MLNNNLQEKLDQYHSGNMSAGDRELFESEIASNPELKAESEFQSEIINGIKEYRKANLKARLDAVDVSPGWLEFARQSALVKSFGGVAVASLIGSAVYFYGEDKVDITETPVLEMEAIGPVETEFEFVWEIPAFEKIAETTTEEVATTPVVAKVESDEVTTAEAVTVVEPAAKDTKTFSPSFEAPVAGEIDDEKEPASSDLDEVPVVATETKSEDPIEVETRNSKNSRIRYKYYDGKLFLTGNFNNEPYEILEINSAKGRRIYLLHQNRYFEVQTNDKLTELPEVTDVKLIQELRVLKANK